MITINALWVVALILIIILFIRIVYIVDDNGLDDLLIVMCALWLFWAVSYLAYNIYLNHIIITF